MAGKKSAFLFVEACAIRFVHRCYGVLFGVVLGAIGIVNEFFDGPIRLAPWMSLTIIGASLFIGAIWAAFDLVRERDGTIANLRTNAVGAADPRYAALHDILGRSTTGAVELSRQHALTALDAWEDHTKQIVAAAYGDGEVAHVFTRELKPDRVVGRRIGRFLSEMPPPKAEAINNMRTLLGRMSELVIRADFDLESWASFDVIGYRESYARPVIKVQADSSEWTCPWCLHEHQQWHGHCHDCRAERVGEFVYADMSGGERSVAGEASPLEEWLGRRIDAARTLESQRVARSDAWYFREMSRWDFDNVSQMHDGPDAIAPDLALRYREDPGTGRSDGLVVAPDGHSLVEGEPDRYYGQRLAWMYATQQKLVEGRSV